MDHPDIVQVVHHGAPQGVQRRQVAHQGGLDHEVDHCPIQDRYLGLVIRDLVGLVGLDLGPGSLDIEDIRGENLGLDLVFQDGLLQDLDLGLESLFLKNAMWKTLFENLLPVFKLQNQNLMKQIHLSLFVEKIGLDPMKSLKMILKRKGLDSKSHLLR